MTRASRRKINGKLPREAKSSSIWAQPLSTRIVSRRKRSPWISKPLLDAGQLSLARLRLVEAPLLSRLVLTSNTTSGSSTKAMHLTTPKRANKRERRPKEERDKPKLERTRGRLTKRKLGSELKTSRLTIRTLMMASRL